ncbi:MAG: 1-acyl-sn-glycerol-3-phosphate acyltransferase [Betaproteobacteria bacterium]|nr:1-acyl-sn-glycerol-3-phosphate acyltransferase [Betaproteobacteria bacterium]
MLRAALRLLRLLPCLAAGFAAAGFFPLLDPAARRRAIALWCRSLLWAVDVRLSRAGAAPRGPALVVANHVSWLDVAAIASRTPATFVCKSEIAAWPGIGWLLERAGTIFIRRGRLRDVLRVNDLVRERLARGETVVFFPEGTTTDGTFVLPFRSALFQPAAERGLPVCPAALAYSTPAAIYVGDTSFAESLFAIAREPRLEASIAFTPALASADRKRAAREARQAIVDACRAPRFAEPASGDRRKPLRLARA